MTTVAVTGATGFLAHHFIPLALSEGHEVRGLARRPVNAAHGSTIGHFDFQTGDVRDAAAVRRLIEGCETVIHLAASFSADDDIPDIIVRGTETVLRAARDVGVQRVVMLSCLGADASSPSPFLQAKWLAESYVRSSGIPFIILRPSVIVGRDDWYVSSLLALIRALPVVPVPGRGEHRQQPIDADDAARVVLRAMTSGDVIDQTVSVGGPVFLTVRHMIDLLSGELGVTKPKALVPRPFIGTVAGMVPAPGRSLFTEPRLAALEHGVVASPGIVQREFGFEPASIVSALAGYIA